MTLPYTWNPMPHQVSVRCPSCGGHACFEFATTCKISLKRDVAFFQDHHSLDYFTSKNSCGHKFHLAAYYPQLHGGEVNCIGDLPEGYSVSDWLPDEYWSRSNSSYGSFLCSSCHHRSKEVINWPEDAYYQVEYKGDILWAFDRSSLVTLREFINSTERSKSNSGWQSFLMKVPTKFLKSNARSKIVRSLDSLIQGN